MLKKVKELLESGAISQETADALDTEWKSQVKVLNDENKDLRKDNETLNKSYEEIVKSKGDLDQELAGLDEKIAQAKKDGQAEIADQLQAEKDSKADLQNSLSSVTKLNEGYKLDDIVRKAFGDYDILDTSKKATEFMLRKMVTTNDTGDAIFTDGDQVTNVADGFKAFFEANSDQLKPQGDPNGGSNAGNHGGSGNNIAPKMSGNTSERVSSIQKMIDDGK